MEKIKEKFNPLVSIIIPVYNGANYMREAIDSALAQTYRNIEVIVVNDGSTDNTDEVAKSYGDEIRYFKKENGGVATALNLAIEKAKGEYISWLSHDDVYYLDKIEKQIRKLSELSKSESLNTILMSNYSLINEKSEITFIQKFHKTHDLKKLNYPLYPLLKGIVHGCTLLIPRHCFEDVGYFDSKLKATQDYDLWFKMFPKYKMLFMPNLFVKSRWHPEQGSKNIDTVNQESDELWIRMIKNLTDEQKIAIDDSVLFFYQKTYDIVSAAKYLGAEKYLFKLLESIKQRDISKIKVSVIIPFFNRINWTVEAIESVTAQTHKNLEIIVVDDNSTDDIQLVRNIATNDKRVKLIKNKRRKGVSGARNTGVDSASGEYIAFLDSDDLFLPQKIEKQLEFMVRNGYLFTHTSYILFSNNEKKEKEIASGNRDLMYPEIIPNCTIATPTVMISSDLFSNNRFIEKYSIGEDTCLWISISKLFCCKGLHQILTRVRMHSTNAAYNDEKMIEGLGNILEYVVDNFLEEKSIPYINTLYKNLISRNSIENLNSIRKIFNKIHKSDNLQISDNDLIGNKFNGHDLHFYLKEMGINSKQLVWHKDSADENTFEIARNKKNREDVYEYAKLIQKDYSLDNTLNPLGYDIILDPLFINSELVHLHLVHNNIFDIQLLPLMSRLKPIVWTLHDPWALGGHCIHHFECEKWKKQCGDCPDMKVSFGLEVDNSALNFTLKKDAIKNSALSVVVASDWMRRKVEKSPIFEGKNISVIPFGINQEIFKPINKEDARKILKIPKDSLVLLLRCDYSGFKGMEMIEYALKNIKTKKRVVIIALKDELRKKFHNFDVREFGWIKSDNLLAQIYSASDIFLMPSKVESFGMMAIEAMSCGTLPIVLEGTALPDTVNAPECGVATKRDKGEYLKAVQYYIDNEEERIGRSKKCLEYARENYNKDMYVEKIMKVYDEVRREHHLSEEDQELLDQLKKHAIVTVASATESVKNIELKVDANQPKDLHKGVPVNSMSILKNAVRVILRKIIFYVSPTFRMLSGNRHRMNILLEKIENLERINRDQKSAILDMYKQQSDIFLEKLDNLGGSSKQNMDVILDSIQELKQLNENQRNRTNLLNISIQKLNKCKCETISCKKEKTKILFVAMLDSIHTARWLSQFAGCEKYEIHLFSVSSGKPHPLILAEPKFLIHEYDFLRGSIHQSSTSDAIEDIINFIKPDIVHTLEMQHSAYLVLPIKKKMLKKFPLWFYSCWGSDIKWFERFPDHKKKIIEVLGSCDALFSGDKESLRRAASEYNFNKPMLNVPSPGGYRVDYYMSKFRITPSIERNIILVKGYSGWVYRPDVVFAALKKCKDEIIKNKLKVVVFLGGDIQNYIDEIKNLGIEIEIFKHTYNYDDMMRLYSISKISLASSLSDGVPNSMLESMLMGCFPILSNCGSADEFIDNGVNGYLLDPNDVDGYATAIRKAIADNKLLDNAMKINREIIKERLDFYKIREIVFSFYDKFI